MLTKTNSLIRLLERDVPTEPVLFKKNLGYIRDWWHNLQLPLFKSPEEVLEYLDYGWRDYIATTYRNGQFMVIYRVRTTFGYGEYVIEQPKRDHWSSWGTITYMEHGKQVSMPVYQLIVRCPKIHYKEAKYVPRGIHEECTPTSYFNFFQGFKANLIDQPGEHFNILDGYLRRQYGNKKVERLYDVLASIIQNPRKRIGKAFDMPDLLDDFIMDMFIEHVIGGANGFSCWDDRLHLLKQFNDSLECYLVVLIKSGENTIRRNQKTIQSLVESDTWLYAKQRQYKEYRGALWTTFFVLGPENRKPHQGDHYERFEMLSHGWKDSGEPFLSVQIASSKEEGFYRALGDELMTFLAKRDLKNTSHVK